MPEVGDEVYLGYNAGKVGSDTQPTGTVVRIVHRYGDTYRMTVDTHDEDGYMKGWSFMPSRYYHSKNGPDWAVLVEVEDDAHL